MILLHVRLWQDRALQSSRHTWELRPAAEAVQGAAFPLLQLGYLADSAGRQNISSSYCLCIELSCNCLSDCVADSASHWDVFLNI